MIPRITRWPQPAFDKGEGGGGPTEPTDPGGRLDPERWIAKYGDAKAALARMATKLDQVEADNADYRQQIKDLSGKVPEEDDIVLTGEEAALYRDLTAENELTVIKERLEAGREAEGRLSELERRERLREVAEAAGITSFEAFERLDEGETYEVRGDGDDRTVVVTYEADGKEVTADLKQYERLKPFHPALFGEREQDAATQRKSYVPQGAASGASPSGKVTEEQRMAAQRRVTNYNL